MRAKQITESNWNHFHYKSESFLSFISIGSDSSGELCYFVNLADHNYLEIHQTTHSNFSDALQSLLDKYGHWELKEHGAKENAGGCGSCVAKS